MARRCRDVAYQRHCPRVEGRRRGEMQRRVARRGYGASRAGVSDPCVGRRNSRRRTAAVVVVHSLAGICQWREHHQPDLVHRVRATLPFVAVPQLARFDAQGHSWPSRFWTPACAQSSLVLPDCKAFGVTVGHRLRRIEDEHDVERSGTPPAASATAVAESDRGDIEDFSEEQRRGRRLLHLDAVCRR